MQHGGAHRSSRVFLALFEGSFAGASSGGEVALPAGPAQGMEVARGLTVRGSADRATGESGRGGRGCRVAYWENPVDLLLSWF